MRMLRSLASRSEASRLTRLCRNSCVVGSQRSNEDCAVTPSLTLPLANAACCLHSPVVQRFRCSFRFRQRADPLPGLLALAARQRQVDIQQGFFDSLLRRERRLFDFGQHARGFFRAVPERYARAARNRYSLRSDPLFWPARVSYM